ECGCRRMFAFPPFQGREGGVFVGRVRHDTEWHLSARRGYARSFTLHLAKVRRPWRVAEACGYVFGREFEQRVERTCRGIHFCVRVPDVREALRNREYGEVGWFAAGDFMPVQRRADTGIGQRAHGISRARGPILRVL